MNNQFAFHMGILHDQVFIQYLFSNGRSPFTPDYDDIDDFSWCDCNVRLTAQGHDFLAALRQKNIWKAVKEDLKENSIETVWKVAQAMATKLATSKLEKYLDATDVK